MEPVSLYRHQGDAALKYLIFAIPAMFLLLNVRFAAAGPSATAAFALLLWFLEPKEPPRMAAWGALLLAAAVAVFKGAGLLIPAVAIPAMAIGAMEFLSRGRREGVPALAPLVACVAMIAAVFLFQAKGSPFEAIGDVRHFVAMGDSLTAGVPGDGVQRLWPEVLASLTGGQAVSLAQPGDTAASSLARWNERIRNRAWIPGNAAWEPDAFIVLLGGNDILRSNDPGALRNDLRKVAEALVPHGKPVLLVSVPGAVLSDRYSGAWADVAAEFDLVEYMDAAALRRIYTTPGYTLPDRIHLNAEGHAELARAIHNRLQGR